MPTIQRNVDVDTMELGQVEYCSVQDVHRMAKSEVGSGFLLETTELSDDSEGSRSFSLSGKGKTFTLTFNARLELDRQVSFKRVN